MLEALPTSGRHPRLLAKMAVIHSRGGDARAGQTILEELRGRAAEGFVEASALGAVTASCGLLPEARALVARGIAEHETYRQFAKSPAWAPFLADADGAELRRAVAF